jgi:glycosyltransferase involved in cell wall biosynthesis
MEWEHEVTVLTCAPNFPDGKVFEGYENAWYRCEEMHGIRVVRLKTFIARNKGVLLRTLDFLSFMIVSFVAGLAQKRPDVVMSTSPQFFAALGAWATAAVRGLPYIFELGDLWPASISAVGAVRGGVALRAMERVELFLYRRARAVIALTRSFKQDLVMRGISPGKIIVARNGVDLALYHPRTRDQTLADELGLADRLVIGYIGTLGMAHALENVLRAAQLLRDNDRIRFLFVGSGASKDTLQAQAKQQALPNVVFVDRQEKSRMPVYWSLCDLALVHLKDSPVFATVIPSKMFEAMGMGVPILLVAPQGEASEIVIDQGVGYWVPAEQPEQLVEAILRISSDRQHRLAAADRAYRAAAQFTRERQASEVLQAAQFVVRGDGARVAEINGL